MIYYHVMLVEVYKIEKDCIRLYKIVTIVQSFNFHIDYIIDVKI